MVVSLQETDPEVRLHGDGPREIPPSSSFGTSVKRGESHTSLKGKNRERRGGEVGVPGTLTPFETKSRGSSPSVGEQIQPGELGGVHDEAPPFVLTPLTHTRDQLEKEHVNVKSLISELTVKVEPNKRTSRLPMRLDFV